MREKSPIQKFVGTVTNVIVVIALAWFLVHSFLTTEEMSGHSMEPAISASDLVLVDRLSYTFMKPKRMDVVIFQRSDATQNVKRVIGLPGETVQIKDGFIYINNEKLDALNDLGEAALAGLAEYPIILDKNEYFLLGDNRSGSEDSRFANVGNVKSRQIKGKVWLRIQPFSRFGLISSR